MDHEEAGRYWNGNAEVWTKLARAGLLAGVFRPGFCLVLGLSFLAAVIDGT